LWTLTISQWKEVDAKSGVFYRNDLAGLFHVGERPFGSLTSTKTCFSSETAQDQLVACQASSYWTLDKQKASRDPFERGNWVFAPFMDMTSSCLESLPACKEIQGYQVGSLEGIFQPYKICHRLDSHGRQCSGTAYDTNSHRSLIELASIMARSVKKLSGSRH
jgi:hypothetical protein